MCASRSIPSSPARICGVNFILSRVPPVLMWSILAADANTAVGPRLSAPCTGEIPSERGMPARRPSGVAPHTEPKYTWHVVGSISSR